MNNVCAFLIKSKSILKKNADTQYEFIVSLTNNIPEFDLFLNIKNGNHKVV